VATDFSDPSLPALDAGREEARHSKERFAAMFSLGLPDMAATPMRPEMGGFAFSEGEIEEMAHSAHERLVQAMNQVHATGDAIIEDGDAADAILKTWDRLRSRLIVLGARGRGFLPRLLLGSVAEKVAREAKCSVLVIRLGLSRQQQPA